MYNQIDIITTRIDKIYKLFPIPADIVKAEVWNDYRKLVSLAYKVLVSLEII